MDTCTLFFLEFRLEDGGVIGLDDETMRRSQSLASERASELASFCGTTVSGEPAVL